LGLDEGIALAIPLRRASVGRERVKPAMDANGEVKPTRRPQTVNARPTSLIGGINLSNRRMRTRLYGGVAGEER